MSEVIRRSARMSGVTKPTCSQPSLTRLGAVSWDALAYLMSSSMELTLVNLSNDGILCGRRTSNANVQVSVALQPSEATSTRIPGHCSEDGITLALLALGEKAQKWTIEHEHLVTRASTIAMPSWRSIDVSEDCPWRVYCRKVRDTTTLFFYH